MNNQSPYRILDIEPDASLGQVKKRYRKLALKYHPDVNPDAKATLKFQELKAAYDAILLERTWRPKPQQAKQNSDLTRKERQAARRRQQKFEAQEKRRRYEAHKLDLEAKYFANFKRSYLYPWTMVMTYVSALMFCLIVVDFFVLGENQHGIVSEKVRTTILGGTIATGYEIQFGEGNACHVSNQVGSSLTEGSYISLRESVIFSDIPQIHVIGPDFNVSAVEAFGKPPHLFFLMFIAVPILIFFVDQPSAVFYSAGAFARYAVSFFILSYIIF